MRPARTAKRLPRQRIACGVSVVALFALVVSAAAVGRDNAPDRPASLAIQQQVVFHAALRAVAPSIVRIDTIGGAQPVKRATNDAGRGRTAPTFRQTDGPTTGIIWSADGYIVTSSFNFVRDPTVITATLADGRRFVARLVARDHPARLALLKIDAADLPTPHWVNTSTIRPGQWTLAAGYGGGGDEPIVSVGVLSAVGRMSGLAVQTDARISPVQYGGPLFDIAGRVIGVCVPMGPGDDELAGVEWYESGIGFAIGFDHLRRNMPRLVDGRSRRRGLLGISLDMRRRVVGEDHDAGSSPADGDSPPTDKNSSPAEKNSPPTDKNSSPADGVRIVGEPRGPAAEAGLLARDVITEIDGVPTPSLIDFKRAVALKAAGDEITVTYRRGSASVGTKLTLASAGAFRDPPPPTPK